MFDLTGLILTFNEQENIGRTLARLDWLPRILVLDSFSTDQTCDIARRFSNVRIEQRRFNTHAAQWNHGLTLVSTPWVLTLDADYIVSEEFRREVNALAPPALLCGYSARFRFLVGGKALRCSIYPPRVVLFKPACCRYVDEGHTQILEADGNVSPLKNAIDHDDRKPLRRWIISQERYSTLEARHLLTTDPATLRVRDRLRLRIFYAPPLMFFYLLFLRGLVLDGWQGWFYVCQRTIAEMLLSIRLLIERQRLETDAK